MTIDAYQTEVSYPTMCSDSSVDNYDYYDMTDAREIAQCRFTWNWEFGNNNAVYAQSGPYPNDDTVECA